MPDFRHLAPRFRAAPRFSLRCPAFFWQHQSVQHGNSTARFWQNTTSTPSNATRARQNAAPGRRLPARRQGRAAVEERGVSDRILNEWCAPFVSSGSIERMVCDEYRGCGRADCGLSFSPATRCGLRGRGPHSNRYRAGKGRRKAAAREGAISRHADVGAQCTQRHSGRSRTRASLCKWTFLCTRRSS